MMWRSCDDMSERHVYLDNFYRRNITREQACDTILMNLQASTYKTRNRVTVRRRRKITDARTVTKLNKARTKETDNKI